MSTLVTTTTTLVLTDLVPIIVVTLLLVLVTKEIVMISPKKRIQSVSELLNILITPLLIVLGITLVIKITEYLPS